MNRATGLLIAFGLSFASAAFGANADAGAALSALAPQFGAKSLGLFIQHNVIGVADIDKMTDWYRRVLGFEAAPRKHSSAYELQALTMPGEFYLNLVSQQGSVRPTGVMDTDKQGLMTITFGTADADSAYKWLVLQGVNILRVSKNSEGKATSIHFTDPEGNHLAILQH